MCAYVRIFNPTKIGKILDINTTLIELYMHRKIVSLLLLFAIFATNVAGADNIAQGVKVVVIDAGHGGAKFPGATYRGVTEKSLNLKVALKLGELIESRMPEVKVVYTRKTDMQFSSDLNKDLQARAEIANKAGGDIFISIHANAARSTSARGVETLIMGESPLEQRVNESVLFANNKEEFIDMSNEKTAAVVRAYIQNLQFTYGEYSEMMARLIQKNYAKSGRVARGIKRQPLKVLYATDMPSVLTEIGFMSNPDELKYMSSEKGQTEIAENLYNAVKEYADFVRRSLLVEEPAKVAPASKTPAQKAVEVVNEGAAPKADKKKPSADKVKSSKEAAPAVSAKKANVPVRKPQDSSVRTVDVKPAQTMVVTAPKNVVVEQGVSTNKSKQEPAPKQEPAATQKVTPKQEPAAQSVTAPKQAPAPKQEPVQNVAGKELSGRAFVVQIMASTTPLRTDDARFGKQRGKVNQYIATGTYKYKYCVGRYADRDAAQRAAMALRSEFDGAFVVEVNGENIVKK